MSKSILVIDTPEKCDGCILHGAIIGKQICNAGIKKIKDSSKKPDWCPLRDLPEKKSENKYHNDYEKGVIDGFNACINEILKDAK